MVANSVIQQVTQGVLIVLVVFLIVVIFHIFSLVKKKGEGVSGISGFDAKSASGDLFGKEASDIEKLGRQQERAEKRVENPLLVAYNVINAMTEKLKQGTLKPGEFSKELKNVQTNLTRVHFREKGFFFVGGLKAKVEEWKKHIALLEANSIVQRNSQILLRVQGFEEKLEEQAKMMFMYEASLVHLMGSGKNSLIEIVKKDQKKWSGPEKVQKILDILTLAKQNIANIENAISKMKVLQNEIRKVTAYVNSAIKQQAKKAA